MAFLIAAFAESELSQQIATSWIMCSGILFFSDFIRSGQVLRVSDK
jgi:hypothetical protein